VTWHRERNRLCEWCHHDNELHDNQADQRVPKEVEPGVYICSDCADCALKVVRNG
jgi:hypothetical protein